MSAGCSNYWGSFPVPHVLTSLNFIRYFESLLLPQRRKRLEAIGWISGYVEYSFKLPGPQYTLMTQGVPGFSFEQHVINSVRGTVIGSKKPCVRPTSVEQTCRIGFGFCHGARFDVERYVRKNKRNLQFSHDWFCQFFSRGEQRK